nr:DapH/DapD/GlmU-related protein [Vibrio fluvialis]
MFFFLKLIFIFFPFISKVERFVNIYRKYEIASYKKKGCSIGDRTMLYRVTLSSSSKGDEFSIGDNCTLTNCTLLGHDASPVLYIPELVKFDNYYRSGSRLSYRKKIIIGNNVFIGYGAIILPGVNIKDNVVVAAGSVVVNDIIEPGVYAGNPAKKIKNIELYTKKYREILSNNPELF